MKLVTGLAPRSGAEQTTGSGRCAPSSRHTQEPGWLHPPEGELNRARPAPEDRGPPPRSAPQGFPLRQLSTYLVASCFQLT